MPNSQIEPRLVRRLLSLRECFHLSRSELAARAGMDAEQVYRIETRNGPISAAHIKRLANALNVRPSSFFEDAPPDAVSNIQDTPRIDEVLALVRLFQRIRCTETRRALTTAFRQIAKTF